MWAVIPVAGEGSRLRSVTSGLPKCLVDVGGRPLIHHLLDQLSTVCEGLCVVLPPNNESIVRALENHPFGSTASTVVQEIPKGLGDAVHRASRSVRDRAFVVMGDTFFGAPLAPVFSDLPSDGGGLVVDPLAADPGEPAGWVQPEAGGIAQAVTKGPRPSADWIRIAGGFVVDSVTLKGLAPSSAPGQFELAIHQSIQAGTQYRLLAFEGPRWNVNTPEQLAELRQWHARAEGLTHTEVPGAGHGG